MATLAERLPGRKATVLDTACCGMAGAFGALAEKYDLSLQVAQRLLDQIDNQPHGTEVIASALLLVDVRRRLPRAENRKRRKHRGTLFPVREIRGRFTGERTGRTSFQ